MSTKIAVIGAGKMLKYQVEGFRSVGAEIVCVADTDRNAAQAAASTYGIPMYFGSLGEVLAASLQIDAVTILVPPASHKELAITALSAGKHVFCEKPPALNAEEALEMKRVADDSGKILMFNLNNRVRPESQEIMRHLKDGFFGKINSAQAVWIRRSGIPAFGSWFTDKSISGGGALIDLLHMLDLALYFMGYPQPKYVLGQTFDDFIHDRDRCGTYGVQGNNETRNVETSVHALVTFQDAQVLTVHCSWAEMVEREQCHVTFQGQRAGGKVSRQFSPPVAPETAAGTCELYLDHSGQQVNQPASVLPDQTMGRVAAAANFVLTIQGEATPMNTPLEAYRLMQIIDAIYLSARSKQPVTFT